MLSVTPQHINRVYLVWTVKSLIIKSLNIKKFNQYKYLPLTDRHTSRLFYLTLWGRINLYIAFFIWNRFSYILLQCIDFLVPKMVVVLLNTYNKCPFLFRNLTVCKFYCINYLDSLFSNATHIFYWQLKNRYVVWSQWKVQNEKEMTAIQIIKFILFLIMWCIYFNIFTLKNRELFQQKYIYAKCSENKYTIV